MAGVTRAGPHGCTKNLSKCCEILTSNINAFFQQAYCAKIYMIVVHEGPKLGLWPLDRVDRAKTHRETMETRLTANCEAPSPGPANCGIVYSPPRGRWGNRMKSDQLKRRKFIALLGGAAAAWPVRTDAKAELPVIGLSSASIGRPHPFVPAEAERS